MKLSIAFALALLGAGDSLAACIVKRVAKPPSEAVCKGTGTVAKEFFDSHRERAFYAPSYTSCVRSASRDADCLSVSYNSKSGECTQYYRALGNAFKAKKGSTITATDTSCYTLNGFCGLANAGFENPPPNHGANTRNMSAYGPTSFTENTSQIFIAPWNYLLNGVSSRQVEFAIGIPSNKTPNLPAAPEGKNYLLASVGVGPSHDVLFGQIVSLRPNAQYRLTYQYAFLSFTRPENYNDTDFRLAIIYQPSNSATTETGEITLNGADGGDVDGKFKRAVASFNTTASAAPAFLSIFFAVPGTPAPSASALFAFDEFKLTQVGTTS